MPGGQEPPATFQPLKVAFSDSLEGQADDPCLPVGPKPSFSLCLHVLICRLEVGNRDSKGALLGVNGFFSWPPFPGQSQGYSTLGGCPASLPSIGPISALSAPRSKPQLWSHRVEEHLRKVGSQGQCQGRKMVRRLRPRATREQIHSLTLQHKRLRSAPCPPPVSWAILAQRA